jgi:hypothetical protein
MKNDPLSADIIGALIDGFAGQSLKSVQVDFDGPCLPPNGVGAEGPIVLVLGNDTAGNGVIAVATCAAPSKAVPLSNGFTRETFNVDAFTTVLSTGPTLNPVVKIIGLDIETTGLPAPLYVTNIKVNGTTTAFDTDPADRVGCIPIFSPF